MVKMTRKCSYFGVKLKNGLCVTQGGVKSRPLFHTQIQNTHNKRHTMKLIRPDLTAVEKWKSPKTKVELELRQNVSLGVLNTIMANSHDESTFNQNRFIISAYMTKFVTKVEAENGDVIVLPPREEIESDGVCLIDLDFLETVPPVLFMELADKCMTKALEKITDVQAKN